MLSSSTVKGNGRLANAEQRFLTRASETETSVVTHTFLLTINNNVL